jgi:uncharacterized protein
VSGLYLDTSALARAMLGHDDEDDVLDALDYYEDRLASSRLLEVELRRTGHRHGVPDRTIDQWLAGVEQSAIDDGLLHAAARIRPTTVATLDAIHLATALRLHGAGLVEALFTFDVRLAEGAREHGLPVLGPLSAAG